MENFKELPLEVQLSAYIDGQLDAADAQEIETLLKSDKQAQSILETLKAGSDFGNQAFEEMLKEPVPLHLVRSIKEASAKPAPVRVAANGNSISFMRFVPQAIAACAVLLLAGGYSGYFIGQRSAAEMPMEISETSAFQAPADSKGVKTRGFTFEAPAAAENVEASEVAGVHDVYAKESTRRAEMPASEADTLKSWLSASTGVAISIPDLSADGLKFEGGRLVALGGKPAGALFYSNAKGDVVGLYYLKGATSDGQLAQGSNEIISGTKGETAWFVATPSGNADIKDIAGKASAAL